MKKEIAIKILMVAGCTVLLLLLNMVLFQLVLDYKLDLTAVYVAAHDIDPRTYITEEDVTEIMVPGAYTLSNVYTSKKDIVGKYTDIQGKIPAGSLFYKTMLYEKDLLPDHAIVQLKDGQTSYTMETDVASLGSIIEGQRVDIHVTIERKDSAPLTGCLIEHARVLAIKDHKGILLTSEESTGIPYLVEIAVEREDVDLLTMAQSVGQIRLFAADDAYSITEEAQRKEDSEVTRYLLSLMEVNKEIENESEIPEVVLPSVSTDISEEELEEIASMFSE